MASKKSAKAFNMAAEIRSILKQNRSLSGREVYEALTKKFPKQKINKSSCGVGFSAARKQLGISQTRNGKKTMRANGAAKIAKPAATTQTVDLATLRGAAKFVSEVGDADRAITAIQQLQTLQIR